MPKMGPLTAAHVLVSGSGGDPPRRCEVCLEPFEVGQYVTPLVLEQGTEQEIVPVHWICATGKVD